MTRKKQISSLFLLHFLSLFLSILACLPAAKQSMVQAFTPLLANKNSFGIVGGRPNGGGGGGVANNNHRFTSRPTPFVGYMKYNDLVEQLPTQPVVEYLVQQQQQQQGNKNNGGVIASDVAAAVGVSLSQARRDLTALASISRGDLAVDAESGELIYTFPANLKQVLQQNSIRFKALTIWRQSIWPVLFWMIRVSFGVALVASVVAIFSTIFFIQTSSSDDDNDRDRDNNGGGRMSFGGGWNYWWGPSPFDFFYYRPYGYYGYYGTGRQQQQQQLNNDPEKMGFLASVFSFIFGDGNPNANLEERRLALAANVIRQNQGSVTAEQLAPFCQEAPSPTDYQEKTFVDESFVLPIVTALNGEPRVTEDGDIIYVFPELQQTTLSSSSSSLSATKNLLEESSSETMILRQAGLSTEASNRDIKRLLDYNGIGTRGIVERAELLQVLEQVLPPLTEPEEAELVANDPTVLQERLYKFSLASNWNKILAGGLGVINLGGALYLGHLFDTLKAAGYVGRLPGWYGTVQAVFPFLLTYAVLFNGIPVVRNFWIQQQNAQIQKRNQIRRDWKQALGTSLKASPTLQKKLAATKKMGTQMQMVGKDILYDTSKTTIEDLARQKSFSALDDFDKKLLEKSQQQQPADSEQ